MCIWCTSFVCIHFMQLNENLHQNTNDICNGIQGARISWQIFQCWSMLADNAIPELFSSIGFIRPFTKGQYIFEFWKYKKLAEAHILYGVLFHSCVYSVHIGNVPHIHLHITFNWLHRLSCIHEYRVELKIAMLWFTSKRIMCSHKQPPFWWFEQKKKTHTGPVSKTSLISKWKGKCTPARSQISISISAIVWYVDEYDQCKFTLNTKSNNKMSTHAICQCLKCRMCGNGGLNHKFISMIYVWHSSCTALVHAINL